MTSSRVFTSVCLPKRNPNHGRSLRNGTPPLLSVTLSRISPPISTEPPLFKVKDVSSEVLDISGAATPPPVPPSPEAPPPSLSSWLTVRSTRLSE
ncbi:hypothetical protein D3C85_1207920 [compost metagenome]